MFINDLPQSHDSLFLRIGFSHTNDRLINYRRQKINPEKKIPMQVLTSHQTPIAAFRLDLVMHWQ